MKNVWVFATITLIAGWMGLATPAMAQWEQVGPNGEKSYALKGAETCLKCHDKAPATNMLHTAHAAKGDPRSPFAQHACESCHGASPEHLKKPAEGQKRALPSIVFRKDSPNTVDERNQACATCHQGGKLMNWSGSQHHTAEVVCVDCHNMHDVKDKALAKADQPQMCFTCHQEQRAQTLRPSHHPIREGQMVCGDCHNPHGSPTQKLLLGRTVNDTCYKCHAETRGPFLWEHAPAREDCTICHSPHGTVQPALLKQRAPFLCQECHTVVAGSHSDTFLSNNSTDTMRLRGKQCMNCHSQIHGSNHPSGPRFMR